MKTEYQTPETEIINISFQTSVLRGSLTNSAIKISNVEVEDYHAGFDEGPEHNDFKDISFD